LLLIEQTHWYECEIWKRMKHNGASLNNPWGIKRALTLKQCPNLNGIGTHLCSFTDREHDVIKKFKGELENDGSITFDNMDDATDWLMNK